MAGILEALGRANLGARAIRLGETLENRETNRLNREVVDVNLRKAKNELAAQDAETANRARPLDITIDPTFMRLDDRLKDAFLQQMKTAGVIDENNRGTVGSVQDHLRNVSENAELWKSTMGQVIELKKKDLIDLDNEVKKTNQKLTESGKDVREDKNYQTLVQRRDALQKDLQISDEGFVTHLNKLEQIEATGVAARKTAVAKAKADARGEATFTKIEGAAFRKFVDRVSMSPQETAIINRKMADPLFAQAVKLVNDDLRFSIRATADEKVAKIFEVFKQLSEARGDIVNPDQPVSIAPPTIEEFLAKAKPQNPEATDEELINFYNNKYGN